MSTDSSSFDTVEPIGGYAVELLVSRQQNPDWGAFLTTLGKLDEQATVEPDAQGALVAFAGAIPSTIRIGHATGFGDPSDLQAAASQTWDWPQLEHALGHAVGRLSVSEESTPPFGDRAERIRRFNVVLRALLEHVPTAAIHWEPAQRLVDPQGFIESLAHGGTITDHAVNVRMFRVPDGRPGETLMDTVGLNHFGVADLQMHFAGLDPSDVAPILLHYAEYVFGKGDVLKDDDLVRGVEALDEWTCKREASLSQPARVVVDIRPDKYGVSH